MKSAPLSLPSRLLNAASLSPRSGSSDDSDLIQSKQPRRSSSPKAHTLPRKNKTHKLSQAPAASGHLQHASRAPVTQLPDDASRRGVLVGSIFRATRAYDPRTDSPQQGARRQAEVTLRTGAVVRALSDVDGEGFIEAQCNGKVGLVPIEFLEPVTTGRSPVNGHAGACSLPASASARASAS